MKIYTVGNNAKREGNPNDENREEQITGII